MTLDDIATYRLANQHLTGKVHTTPKDVVGHLGAMQAQDYAMAKWAIGIRLSTTEKAVEAAINNGDIIRTHILRPTWHFVSADDIGWMLALTAPHVKTIIASMCRRHELDENVLNRCNAIMEKALAGNNHLTRSEIMSLLNEKGIATDDIRSTLIMMNAELDGLVCNGRMRGKQFTYSLLYLSKNKKLTKEEGLAALAKRYFTSHGPATLQDFSWWSGLSVVNSRAALEAIRSTLHFEKTADQTYWFPEAGNDAPVKAKTVHFLPAFDEFLISYKDRSASVRQDMTKQIIVGNGIFKPTIIVNGKVTGYWKRTIKKDTMIIETHFFDNVGKTQKQAIFKAAEQYGDFMELSTIVQ